MERPTTPKRLSRPILSRSHSATTTTTSPPRSQPALHQALPNLHLHTRNHNHHDRQKRYGEKITVAHAALNAPSVVPSVIADKLTSSRPGSKTGRDTQASHQKFQAEENNVVTMKISQRSIRPVDIAKERHRRVRREEELRSTLNELTELASASTRRVDRLYMNIMEKVATLRRTIHKLQQLATETSNVHKEFEEDAQAIAGDFEGQVEAFKGFEEQQQQVESLRGRIQTSIEKSEALQERLKAARDRVASWEKREDEWQARTSMKLRIGWTCVGVLIGLIVTILILKAIYLRTKSAIVVMEPSVSAPDLEHLWEALKIERPRTPIEWVPREDITTQPNDTKLREFDEL